MICSIVVTIRPIYLRFESNVKLGNSYTKLMNSFEHKRFESNVKLGNSYTFNPSLIAMFWFESNVKLGNSYTAIVDVEELPTV